MAYTIKLHRQDAQEPVVERFDGDNVSAAYDHCSALLAQDETLRAAELFHQSRLIHTLRQRKARLPKQADPDRGA